MIAEEEASTRTPTDADLSAYLAANQGRFLQPAILTFEQVFLGQSTSGPGVVRAVAVTHQALRNGRDPADTGHANAAAVSDDPHRCRPDGARFRRPFAAALETMPIGEWAGPIESSFGSHYVRVSDRTPAVVPQLDAVRDQVVREWESERRQRARTDAYARMRDDYEVSSEATMPKEQR